MTVSCGNTVAAVSPVASTVLTRVLPRLRAKDLRSRSAVNIQNTRALFGLTIKHGANTMRGRRANMRIAWIIVSMDSFCINPIEPGPFGAHKMSEGRKSQRKLNKLLLDVTKL